MRRYKASKPACSPATGRLCCFSKAKAELQSIPTTRDVGKCHKTETVILSFETEEFQRPDQNFNLFSMCRGRGEPGDYVLADPRARGHTDQGSRFRQEPAIGPVDRRRADRWGRAGGLFRAPAGCERWPASALAAMAQRESARAKDR